MAVVSSRSLSASPLPWPSWGVEKTSCQEESREESAMARNRGSRRQRYSTTRCRGYRGHIPCSSWPPETVRRSMELLFI